MTYLPRPYYLWTSSNPSVVLPAGIYMFRHTSGGGAGGGCPAGAASVVSFTLTAYNKPSSSSLQFLNPSALAALIMGYANGPNNQILVTGTGISGAVAVQKLNGDDVQLVAVGGTIGTLSGTAAYTFFMNNSGGGGGSSQPSDQIIISDGVTAFDITVGAGGTGVSGATGNNAGQSNVTQSGGPPNLQLISPIGGGGSVGGSSFVGAGGSSATLGPMGNYPGGFWPAGSGGSCVSGAVATTGKGYAAYQNPSGGAVGGGAGGISSDGLHGGGAGQDGWIVGGGSPGTDNGASGVTGQNGTSVRTGAGTGGGWGCGGGGAGGNATAAASANTGGNGGPGKVEAWRLG